MSKAKLLTNSVGPFVQVFDLFSAEIQSPCLHIPLRNFIQEEINMPKVVEGRVYKDNDKEDKKSTNEPKQDTENSEKKDS